MAAGIYNFTIEQGATFTRTFKYKDSTGTAISLANHAIRMQIRDSIGAPTPLLSIDEENGFNVDGTNTNEFTLTLSATITKDLTFNTAVYDIEIEDNSNVVTRLLQGKIKLSKEVTR